MGPGVQTSRMVGTGTLRHLCPSAPIELVVGVGGIEESYGPFQETTDYGQAGGISALHGGPLGRNLSGTGTL